MAKGMDSDLSDDDSDSPSIDELLDLVHEPTGVEGEPPLAGLRAVP